MTSSITVPGASTELAAMRDESHGMFGTSHSCHATVLLVGDHTGPDEQPQVAAALALDGAHERRLGSLAASEVISHIGARPEVSLAKLAAPLLDG